MQQYLDFFSLFYPDTILCMVVATGAGMIIGALPGLTATMAVSLMVSLTYSMHTRNAMAVLIGLYLGGIYGGSRSAILLNVPGTPSSAATAIEGFPLTRRGEGTRAGIVATTFSVLGALLGLIFLVFLTKPISRFALKVGSWEMFWLGMFGVLIAGNIGSKKPYKGFIAGLLGLFFAMVGMDPLYGNVRYTFGSTALMGGISMVPAMIGMFGMTEVFCTIADPESHLIEGAGNKVTWKQIIADTKWSFVKLKERIGLFLTSSVVGTLIGALPGVGPDIASWVSYDMARRSSKEKHLFGQGSYDGVIASETANNAATSGVFIPLLTLGIPGCGVSAIIMGAMQLHNYRPGPTFFIETPEFAYFVMGALLFVNIIMFFEGVAITPMIARVLTADSGTIMVIVVVLTIVGSYAVSIKSSDIMIMLFFGFLGYFLRKLDLPSAPVALGLILGTMVDESFRRGVLAAQYDYKQFFVRPISLVLWVCLVVITVWPLIRRSLDKKKAAKEAVAEK